MKIPMVKQYFEQALFELIKTEKYEDITIGKLCEKAGVCRSSFYRNYLVMDDIVEQYLTRVFANMSHVNNQDMKKNLEDIFNSLLEQKEKLVLLNKRGMLHNIFEYLYSETLSQIISLEVLNNYYQPYFFAGAASAVIRAWINRGMEETPKKMSELFLLSLKGYMEI